MNSDFWSSLARKMSLRTMRTSQLLRNPNKNRFLFFLSDHLEWSLDHTKLSVGSLDTFRWRNVWEKHIATLHRPWNYWLWCVKCIPKVVSILLAYCLWNLAFIFVILDWCWHVQLVLLSFSRKTLSWQRTIIHLKGNVHQLSLISSWEVAL